MHFNHVLSNFSVISVFTETGIFSATSLPVHSYQFFSSMFKKTCKFLPIPEEGICRTSNLIVLCWGHVPRTFWIDCSVRVESSLFQRSWLRGGMEATLIIVFLFQLKVRFFFHNNSSLYRSKKRSLFENVWKYLYVDLYRCISIYCYQ